MAPIRLIGKVSLSDEITMLDQLRTTLRAAKEQTRLIADSTGDDETKYGVRGYIGAQLECSIDKADLLYFRSVEAQREMGEETGCVELREDLGR